MALGSPTQMPGVPPPTNVDHLTPEVHSRGTPRQQTVIDGTRLHHWRPKVGTLRPEVEDLCNVSWPRRSSDQWSVQVGAWQRGRNRDGHAKHKRKRRHSSEDSFESADTRSFGGKHLALLLFCIALGSTGRFSFSRIPNQFRDNIGSRNTCAARFRGCVVDDWIWWNIGHQE